MVSCGEEELVYGIKLSSVGPGTVTGQNVVYEPSNADLAAKLHYLRVVYFFSSEAVRGLTVQQFKETSFTWLNYYYESCGRFRRSESTGRPYVKCNDCGVRFVEAKSSKTLDQWLHMIHDDDGHLSSHDASPQRLLVPNQVLGPELTFSPQVLIQLTFLKCGGISVGLSWAHVLGDAFSASEFIITWGRILSGNRPTHSPNLNKSKTNESMSPKSTLGPHPLSLKTLDPVGDHWMIPTSCKMDTLSFHLSPAKLAQIQTKISDQVRTFEAICALIWKSIARAKDGPEPKRLTIIREDNIERTDKEKDKLRNTQVVSVVEVDVQVGDADPTDLAMMLGCDRAVDERSRISEMVGKEAGMVDVVLYGTNLTFVDLEGANWYGFELPGRQKPSLVNCFVDGVEVEGVVLVLPGPKLASKREGEAEAQGKEEREEGRLVTMILPEHQTMKLKQELAKEWTCFGV